MCSSPANNGSGGEGSTVVEYGPVKALHAIAKRVDFVKTVNGVAPKRSGVSVGELTLLMAKAKAALDAFNDNDFVLLHVKAADVCGHDGKPTDKIRVVEKVDKMLGYIRDHPMENFILAVTSDHSTPCAVRNHSGDPVPLLVFGEGVRVDDVQTFDEIACAKESLGRLRGVDLLPLLLDLSNRNVKFGA